MQSTHANIAADTNQVTLMAERLGRLGGTIVNDSASATLYVKFATGVSATSYAVALGPGQFYELPLLPSDRVWTGVVTGVWSAAVGAARVSEVW